MNWTKKRPHLAGYYWLLEQDKEPYIAEIRVEDGRRTILKIGDTRQYPVEILNKALWCGPLEPC